jgi:hypothetical protein
LDRVSHKKEGRKEGRKEGKEEIPEHTVACNPIDTYTSTVAISSKAQTPLDSYHSDRHSQHHLVVFVIKSRLRHLR